MTPVNLRTGKRRLLALPRVLGHYLEARKSLRGSISRQSRQGLDWMKFFLADVHCGGNEAWRRLALACFAHQP
jgi:hypothetical protein